MKQVSKNHHYVPQWLQKIIVDEDQAYYIDKNKNKETLLDSKQKINCKIKNHCVTPNLNANYKLLNGLNRETLSEIDNKKKYSKEDTIEKNLSENDRLLCGEITQLLSNKFKNKSVDKIVDILKSLAEHLIFMSDTKTQLIEEFKKTKVVDIITVEGGEHYAYDNLSLLGRIQLLNLYKQATLIHKNILICNTNNYLFVGDKFIQVLNVNHILVTMFPISKNHMIFISNGKIPEDILDMFFEYYIQQQTEILANDTYLFEHLKHSCN